MHGREDRDSQAHRGLATEPLDRTVGNDQVERARPERDAPSNRRVSTKVRVERQELQGEGQRAAAQRLSATPNRGSAGDSSGESPGTMEKRNTHLGSRVTDFHRAWASRRSGVSVERTCPCILDSVRDIALRFYK